MKKGLLLFLVLITALLQQAVAQDRAISGRVTDRANSQGLPGVTVLVKGTTIGVSTNEDGNYVINAPASATTLVFSSIGYVSVEQPISSSTINVALGADSKQLGEVVVTGALGIQRQEQQVGYATATLDTKEVTQARPTNVVNGLAGKVSGLQVQTIGSGISPQVRITLRGSRSLTGNNEALIVIDGNISTNDALIALNPDDVASTTILKGANAAALYGSQASNGALIITTKRGDASAPRVTFSQTSQFESVSFLPEFQKSFGLGANSWNQTREAFSPDNGVDINEDYQYNGFENQQFGPRFDGSLRPLGTVLADGSVQLLPYEARPNEKRDFFNTGYQAQNSVTFSGGDAKTRYYASYQNLHNSGIVPKDKFDRNTFRFNASHEFNRLTVGTNISYTLQRTDATSNVSRDESVYWNWFNTGVQVPLTSYKDWRNNPYANPNGYYNAFYHNPYYILENNRTNDRRNTLIGSIDLTYKFTDWLKANYRIGITNIDQSSLQTQDQLRLTDFTLANTYKSYQPAGFVRDIASNQNRINSDAFLSMDKIFGDISVQAILGNNVQQFSSDYRNVASTGLSAPGLFNLSNRVGNLTGGDASAKVRSYAFYADATVGYKEFIYLHGSGRYDNVSNLNSGNNSFFYPGVDVSFVFSNVVPGLKEASFLDYGKLRGGVTKVSQINLGGTNAGAYNSTTGVYNTFGAYALEPTFNLGTGYPFGSTASYTASNQLVNANLKPETTISTEVGIELSFLKRRVSLGTTYYKQNSKNQTISTSISRGTGYSANLINAGEVENQGVEVDLNFVPVRLDNGLTFTIGGNFNYNNNKVVSLPDGLDQLNLSTGGNAQLYAIPGQPFPILRGSYYQRVGGGPDGLIVMAPTRNPIDPQGDPTQYYYPVKASDLKTFGNTQPKYKYGFNTSLTYKGITLAGQAELRTGYVVYNSIGEDLDFTGSGARTTQYNRENFVYPNSAIPQNDVNGNTVYVPNTEGLTPGGAEFWAQNSTWNRTVAENYVTSGRFFKIREVTLGYALPASIVSKIGFVKGASLSLFGRNIFTWVPKENIYTDPEFSFSNSNAIGINTNLQTPPTKFYGATLTASF